MFTGRLLQPLKRPPCRLLTLPQTERTVFARVFFIITLAYVTLSTPIASETFSNANGAWTTNPVWCPPLGSFPPPRHPIRHLHTVYFAPLTECRIPAPSFEIIQRLITYTPLLRALQPLNSPSHKMHTQTHPHPHPLPPTLSSHPTRFSYSRWMSALCMCLLTSVHAVVAARVCVPMRLFDWKINSAHLSLRMHLFLLNICSLMLTTVDGYLDKLPFLCRYILKCDFFDSV